MTINIETITRQGKQFAVEGRVQSACRHYISVAAQHVDDSVEVWVPLATLFGRHLAVVGATGSGKSWTLGHLAASVNKLPGKMILIDAL